jgi:CHAD domain-containing protein
MARWEKWLTEVGPDAPVAGAARIALVMRLKAVEHFLKKAGQVSGKADADAEAVHQLRIWTRRAAAALRLFADVLTPKRAKWLKRKLKAIRHTAGEARDCDVLAARLESGDLPRSAPSARLLRARRKRAEKRLAKRYKSLIRSGKFRRKCDRLLKALDRPSSSQSRNRTKHVAFVPWCREQLVPLSNEFHQLAAGDLSRDEKLHALRISGKRLRYALELAPAALPAVTHRRLYDELSDLQDRLGHVCDQIVAVRQLQEWCDQARGASVREELCAAGRHQRKQLTSAKQQFRRWWSPKRRATLRKSWQQALRDRAITRPQRRAR